MEIDWTLIARGIGFLIGIGLILDGIRRWIWK